MTLALHHLLTAHLPQFRTTKALVVILPPQGDSVPSSGDESFFISRLFNQIDELAQAFRAFGHVYWIRSGPDRASKTALNGSAAYATDSGSQITDSSAVHSDELSGYRHPLSSPKYFHPLSSPQDTTITTTKHSAFNDTQLLQVLRARFATEIYLIGPLCHPSFFATARDAACHGIAINIVEDCLWHIAADAHNTLQRLIDDLGAALQPASDILSDIRVSNDRSSGSVPSSPSRPRNDRPQHNHDMEEAHRMRGSDHLGSTVVADGHHDATQHRYSVDASASAMKGDDSCIDVAAVEGDETLGESLHPDSITPDSIGLATPTTDPFLFVEVDGGQVAGVRPEEELDRSAKAVGASAGPLEDIFTQSPTKLDELQNGRKRSSTDLDDVDVDLLSADNKEQPCPAEKHDFHKALASRKRSKGCIPSLANFPVKGPGDHIGAGDSFIQHDLMPADAADNIFYDLLAEVHWQTMSHADGEVPRLVCCQGTISPTDGSLPVYRHPSDSSLPLLQWSRTVNQLRTAAEQVVGHRLNHVLIQLYRGGTDHISEHSDKTLDIQPGSKIVNVSFGARRTMRLRSKRSKLIPNGDRKDESQQLTLASKADRITERIHLPHNSIFVLGPQSNQTFLHGIQPDRRRPQELSEPETAYGGLRISLTFRHIGTFLNASSTRIWGLGATAKTATEARPTVNGEPAASQDMINAFGRENQEADSFDRDKVYGRGSDVLHLKSVPAEVEADLTGGTLFLADNNDDAAARGVQMYLAHIGLPAPAVVRAPDLRIAQAQAIDGTNPDQFTNAEGKVIIRPSLSREIMYRSAPDSRGRRVQVVGLVPTLLYLQRTYNSKVDHVDRLQSARECEILASASALLSAPDRAGLLSILERWLMDFQLERGASDSEIAQEHKQEREHMATNEQGFLAGSAFGAVDCIFFPVVKGVTRVLDRAVADEETGGGHGTPSSYPLLTEWVQRVEALRLL